MPQGQKYKSGEARFYGKLPCRSAQGGGPSSSFKYSYSAPDPGYVWSKSTLPRFCDGIRAISELLFLLESNTYFFIQINVFLPIEFSVTLSFVELKVTRSWKTLTPCFHGIIKYEIIHQLQFIYGIIMNKFIC